MKKLIIFLIGSSIAGVAGYKIGYAVSKKKYETLADDEVESVKQSLKNHYETKYILTPKLVGTKGEQTTKKPENVLPKASIEKIVDVKKLPEKDLIDYGKQYRTETTPERIPGNPGAGFKHLKKEEVDTTKPYIITSEDFQDSEYECVTLFYFEDKVLTDDDYNQITNVGIVGGYSILDQMGIYDSDCLYVRDDKNGIDYEILLEERVYSKIKPLGVVEED